MVTTQARAAWTEWAGLVNLIRRHQVRDRLSRAPALAHPPNLLADLSVYSINPTGFFAQHFRPIGRQSAPARPLSENHRILTHDALQIPGAIAVLTPDDLLPHINAVRPGEPGVSTYSRSYNRYPLPRETVTFSGEAVAAVVAQNRYSAEDMVEAVQVAYTPLPVVLDVDHSLAPDAPRIHADLADNILFHRRFGAGGEPLYHLVINAIAPSGPPHLCARPAGARGRCAGHCA